MSRTMDLCVGLEPNSAGWRVSASEIESDEVMAEHGRQILVVEDEVVDLWRTVGSSQGLTTDGDIARFLLSLYFGESEQRVQGPVQCVNCQLPLRVVCDNCGLAQPDPSLVQCSQYRHHSRPVLQQPVSALTKSWKASSQLIVTAPENVPSQQSVSQKLLPLTTASPSPEPNDNSNFSDMDTFEGAPADETETLETDSAENANVEQHAVSTLSGYDSQICSQMLNKTCHKFLVVKLTRCDSQNVPTSQAHASPKVGVGASPDGKDKVCDRGTSDRKDKVFDRGTSDRKDKVCDRGTSDSKDKVCDRGTSDRKDKVCDRGTSDRKDKVCDRGTSDSKDKVCDRGTSDRKDKVCDRGTSDRKDKVCDRGTSDALLKKLPCTSTQSGFPEQCDSQTDSVSSSTENSSESHELQKLEMLRAETEGNGSAEKTAEQSNCQTKQLEKTLSLFMAGKMKISLSNNYFTHYTCFKCHTVFKSKKLFSSHNQKTCSDTQKHKRGFDAKDKEILTRVKERHLLCCPYCDVVFIRRGNIRNVGFEQHVLAHTSTVGSAEESMSGSQVAKSTEDCGGGDDTSLLDGEKNKRQGELPNQTSGKHVVYEDFFKRLGITSYCSGYSCSQCGKTFRVERECIKHLNKPSCDAPNSVPLDDTPRAKRKCALKVNFSEEDNLGESETEAENEEERSKDSEDQNWQRQCDFNPKRKKILSPSTLKKRHTLKEFMTGKYRIPLYVKSTNTIYSHFYCNKCNTVVETPTEIIRHKRGKGDNPCLNPKGQYPPPRTELDARSIELLKKIKDEHLLCCPFCDEVFLKRNLYKQHVFKHKFTVDDNGMHVCNICSQTFPKYEQLYQHVAVSDSNQTCSVCGKFFTSKCQISAHMASHPDYLEMIKCKVCGESVPKSQKRKHNQNHHGVVYKCICPQCGKLFANQSALNAHVVVHSDDRPFSCKVCGKSFKRNFMVRYHEVRHEEKKHQCEICGANFHFRKQLKQHTEENHLKVQYPCDICGRKFKAKRYLSKHKRRHLNFDRSVTCEQCGVLVNDIKSHMLVHSGEKPYHCKFCSAKFGRRDYLIKHTRLHTGEKPFPCGNCHQRFACLSSYKYHMRKHHSELLLTCSLCQVKCVDQKRLDYHLDMVHGLQAPVKDDASSSELGVGHCETERPNDTPEPSSTQTSMTTKSNSTFDVSA